IPDDRRNLLPAEAHAGAPATLARDELPVRLASARRRPDDDRLEQPVLAQRSRQIGEVLLGELAPRLIRVRRDTGDGQHPSRYAGLRHALLSQVFAEKCAQPFAEAVALHEPSRTAVSVPSGMPSWPM